MIRTQIQLPDALYQELKALAADKEWSLAEAVRRAAEQLLERYPRRRAPRGGWHLPKALPLGDFRAPAARWRELANEPSASAVPPGSASPRRSVAR